MDNNHVPILEGRIVKNSTINSCKKYQWTFVFVGNPSRGDDGIGPTLFKKMNPWLDQQHTAQTEKTISPSIDIQLIECFQLEPELCCDIENTTALIIVDASTIKKPLPWIETLATATSNTDQNANNKNNAKDAPVWTHAMSPASLLALFTTIYKKPPPATYLLHIPGEKFDLGAQLSQTVKKHQSHCSSLLQQCCLATSPQELQQIISNNTADSSHNNSSGLENA